MSIYDIDDKKKEEKKHKEEEELKEKEKKKEKDKEEKNEINEKIITLFQKIKTFEELKKDVSELKKTYEKNAEGNQEYKGYKDKNNFISKDGITFEKNEEEKNFKNYLNERIEEIDKKLNIIFGGEANLDEGNDINFNIFEEKNINNAYNGKNVNNINNRSSFSNIGNNKNYNNFNSKSIEQEKRPNFLNLREIFKRLTQLKLTKVNQNDYDSKNDKINKKLEEIESKIDDLMSKLFGINNKINISQNNSNNSNNVNANIDIKKNISFVSNIEFEEYLDKSEKEFIKIWEEINNLRNSIEDIYSILKEKISLTDLDNMKSLILKKIEELFKNLNKKNNENSLGLKNLLGYFKKLLELLSSKEENGNESWIISKKPDSGFSCASCETFLGELKDDKNKFVNWKKMPLRGKELSGDGLFKIGNGYSRLLQMINFDNNGNATLNPFSNTSDNSYNNINNNSSILRKNKSRNGNEPNKPKSRERVLSVNMSKIDNSSKNKSIDLVKDKDNVEYNINVIKKLPSIKCSSSTDNFEKRVEIQNIIKSGNNPINYNLISPKIHLKNKLNNNK